MARRWIDPWLAGELQNAIIEAQNADAGLGAVSVSSDGALREQLASLEAPAPVTPIFPWRAMLEAVVPARVFHARVERAARARLDAVFEDRTRSVATALLRYTAGRRAECVARITERQRDAQAAIDSALARLRADTEQIMPAVYRELERLDRLRRRVRAIRAESSAARDTLPAVSRRLFGPAASQESRAVTAHAGLDERGGR
jgi:hypothetical protein